MPSYVITGASRGIGVSTKFPTSFSSRNILDFENIESEFRADMS